jgi:hypothetical protein
VVETIWSGARLVEGGQSVAIDVRNDTDTPELVHWHGQMIPSDVDAAAEEGTPFVPSKLAALGKGVARGGPGGRAAHRFSRDSPLEGTGFEPSVPQLRRARRNWVRSSDGIDKGFGYTAIEDGSTKSRHPIEGTQRSPIMSLKNKVAIVTGGNSGVGHHGQKPIFGSMLGPASKASAIRVIMRPALTASSRQRCGNLGLSIVKIRFCYRGRFVVAGFWGGLKRAVLYGWAPEGS